MDNLILPISKKVFAKTIGFDLIPVKPMKYPSYMINRELINEVKIINRDRKIDSIVNGYNYEEMKLKDHPEYNTLPYIDVKFSVLKS